MKIIRREQVLAFLEDYPDSRSSLSAWLEIIEQNKFSHFVRLRNVFRSADYVKPYTVFNISGNKYRLIALINYNAELLSIERILTHSEYDKGRWRN